MAFFYWRSHTSTAFDTWIDLNKHYLSIVFIVLEYFSVSIHGRSSPWIRKCHITNEWIQHPNLRHFVYILYHWYKLIRYYPYHIENITNILLFPWLINIYIHSKWASRNERLTAYFFGHLIRLDSENWMHILSCCGKETEPPFCNDEIIPCNWWQHAPNSLVAMPFCSFFHSGFWVLL